MVTGNDRASFLTFCQFAQFRAANGVGQGVSDEFGFRFRCFVFMRMRYEHAGYLFFRKFEIDFTFTEGNGKILHR